MVAAVRRLLHYVAGVVAALALLECAFRCFEADLAASASRVATKEALLGKQADVQVLFLGTSRFWDGIAPRRFAAAFPGTHAFSLATSGAKLETLEEAAARCARRPGLRVAFIELSRPQLDPAPPPPPAPSGLEGLAARASKLIEHRAALRGESLLRLPALLLFPGRMDGSEVSFADHLSALRGDDEGGAPDLDPRPAPVEASRSPTNGTARRMEAVGERFRAAGVEAIFVLPPILPCEPPEDLAAVAADLASRFPVWDYRSAFPASAFRDCSHLSREGRASFSDALARQALRAGLGDAIRSSSRQQVHADLHAVPR